MGTAAWAAEPERPGEIGFAETEEKGSEN
jgi:hypothetical protein